MHVPEPLAAALRCPKQSILAIDPGKSGAVARLSVKGSLMLQRDFKCEEDIAEGLIQLYQPGDELVAENVHAMPGQGVCSMFSFGTAFGVARGAAYVLEHAGRGAGGTIPKGVFLVSPQAWQNFFRRHCDIPKGTLFQSRDLAGAIWPHYAETWFRRKKDHNSADAALMAAWRYLTLSGFE